MRATRRTFALLAGTVAALSLSACTWFLDCAAGIWCMGTMGPPPELEPDPCVDARFYRDYGTYGRVSLDASHNEGEVTAVGYHTLPDWMVPWNTMTFEGVIYSVGTIHGTMHFTMQDGEEIHLRNETLAWNGASGSCADRLPLTLDFDIPGHAREIYSLDQREEY